MALRHTVLIVTNSGGLEFHLDHRVVDETGLAAWIADAGDAHPSFRVAAGWVCQRGAASAAQPGAAASR